MMLNYIMLLVALALSGVAAYYSIAGLVVLFAAATIPVAVMASLLELAKVVATSWVYRNWSTAPMLIKYYLVLAVFALMFITSMGIFGFLSKAHSEQGLVSGDAVAKLEIVDEKIRTAKTNIEVSRKALKQLDDAVDQIMARSQSEKSVNSAIYVRRTQQKERTRLMADIEAEQKRVSVLNEERAPLAAQVRKVEAEVGPLKYIAQLFYDDVNQNVLETAVRWVIIILVSVFDPLAIILLVAANHSLQRGNQPTERRPGKQSKQKLPDWLKYSTRVERIKQVHAARKNKNMIEIDKDSVVRF